MKTTNITNPLHNNCMGIDIATFKLHCVCLYFISNKYKTKSHDKTSIYFFIKHKIHFNEQRHKQNRIIMFALKKIVRVFLF